MNNILNFLYGNLHFVAGLLLFGIGLIALIHFWKVKKALLGCEAALAGIQQGINLGIQQAAANTTTGNAEGTEVSLVMGNFRGEFEQAYTLTRKQSRSTFGLAVFIFILGAVLLLGASVFLICVASDFSADLNSFLATAVLQGKSISTIADLASGLRLQAALIPALSGLILILASLIAALRVHRKAASQLEYYQRCLEEDKRVLISVELLEKFKESGEANASQANASQANASQANASQANASQANASQVSAPPANEPQASTPPANEPQASTPPANEPQASTPPASAPQTSAPQTGDPPAVGSPSKNEALMKIIESQMELNKRDMGPEED